MHLGHRHQSMRKRGLIFPVERSYRVIKMIDVLTYVASFTSLAVTLDQLRLIYVTRDVAGVSLMTWGFYTLSSFVWLVYGHLHRDKVLIVTNIFWIVVNVCIVSGILMYR